jgi:hypothetical protein
MVRTKSRPIRLSAADRQMLTGLARTGSHPAQEVRRARILLALAGLPHLVGRRGLLDDVAAAQVRTQWPGT